MNGNDPALFSYMNYSYYGSKNLEECDNIDDTINYINLKRHNAILLNNEDELINDKDAKLLAQALKQNTSMTIFELHDCRFTAYGLNLIIKELKDSKIITKIYFEAVHLDHLQIYKLFDAFISKPSSIQFNINNDSSNNIIKNKFMPILMSNNKSFLDIFPRKFNVKNCLLKKTYNFLSEDEHSDILIIMFIKKIESYIVQNKNINLSKSNNDLYQLIKKDYYKHFIIINKLLQLTDNKTTSSEIHNIHNSTKLLPKLEESQEIILKDSDQKEIHNLPQPSLLKLLLTLPLDLKVIIFDMVVNEGGIDHYSLNGSELFKQEILAQECDYHDGYCILV